MMLRFFQHHLDVNRPTLSCRNFATDNLTVRAANLLQVKSSWEPPGDRPQILTKTSQGNHGPSQLRYSTRQNAQTPDAWRSPQRPDLDQAPFHSTLFRPYAQNMVVDRMTSGKSRPVRETLWRSGPWAEPPEKWVTSRSLPRAELEVANRENHLKSSNQNPPGCC